MLLAPPTPLHPPPADLFPLLFGRFSQLDADGAVEWHWQARDRDGWGWAADSPLGLTRALRSLLSRHITLLINFLAVVEL